MWHLQRYTGESRFPLYDGIGSARRLVDASNNHTDAYSLIAYGMDRGGWINTPNPYRFGGAWGYLTDPSGMLQLGARYYWPEVGRFVSRDPVRDDLVNPYLYAAGNPLWFADPEGTVEWCVAHAAARGAAEGLVCSLSCNLIGVPIKPRPDDDDGCRRQALVRAAKGGAKSAAVGGVRLGSRHLARRADATDGFVRRYGAWKRAGGGLGPQNLNYGRGFRWNAVTRSYGAKAARFRMASRGLGLLSLGMQLWTAIECAKECSS